MSLRLPAKAAPASPENVRTLHDGFTSVIAGHPGAVHPWTFYEELDTYLGPWGNTGYPIGYGKYYCMAFNGNQKLQDNAETREWVRRTTVALQEPLRDLVVQRFRAGSLPSLTEAQLRQAAFAMHPQAYTQGGLAMVVLTAPEMLPIIASIPSAQFNPLNPNFTSSVRQVFTTLDMVLPEAAGMTLAATAGPAHTGLFTRAVQMDQAEFQRERNTIRWLDGTLRVVRSGEMDSIPLLNRLTDRLNATQFGQQGMADLARQVVQAANTRKHAIAAFYRGQITQNPSMRASIDRLAPGWSAW